MSDDSPRLYLLAPAGASAASFPPLLEKALKAADVACLLIDTSRMREDDALALAKKCQPLCASRDTALLLTSPHLVKPAKADGLHVRQTGEDIDETLTSAVRQLKPDLIVGAGMLRNRHAAMSAGELDVDYVLFGEPAADGHTPPFSQTLDRVTWWCEIFNVPCVAFAASIEDAAALAAAGAEFVALREAIWNDPRGVAAALEALYVRLAMHENSSGAAAAP